MKPDYPAQTPLTDFFHKGRKVNFDKGEVILRASDTPSGVFFIEEGHVKVYSISRTGTEHLHIIYRAGEIFPLIWFSTGRVPHVFYEALDKTTVYRVARKDLKDLIKDANPILEQLFEQSVEQFRIFANRLDNLELADVNERLACRLLSLANRFGHRDKEGVIIDLPMTHQLLAESINFARETTSRASERLIRKGYIKYNANHRIIIKDVQGLIKEAGSDASELAIWDVGRVIKP